MGGRATIPAIDGFGKPGSFVLRQAADAVALRADVQGHRQPRAIVAGGGLLGLEAGHALHELGVDVTIAERSSRMLSRALDEPASQLLRSYFESTGITVRTNVELAAIAGDERVTGVITGPAILLECDTLIVAAGMTPNAELASAAGLDVGRGVVVDEQMRSSDPDIFAVGDVAEFAGHAMGSVARRREPSESGGHRHRRRQRPLRRRGTQDHPQGMRAGRRLVRVDRPR